MVKDTTDNLGYALIGSVTTASLGGFFLESFGALLLGLLGAVGGYMFNRFVRHRLDRYFNKKVKEKINKKQPKAE